MWARNRGHSAENARKVADKLEAAHHEISQLQLNRADAISRMKLALQKIGAEVFGD